ncbi:hypothetical protein LUZ63_004069 [Rhynchospora breviuscula]|uniref:Reverse transcriptase zinc-binding domain-containing protein n=1 Tax=Rhynchospora breviuscula TaxID=2022672 RepID=A0A9Q0D1T3_9POAL|nr:hypothetical protein LUZ63_004069 [Rhynchospora breviuscula]
MHTLFCNFLQLFSFGVMQFLKAYCVLLASRCFGIRGHNSASFIVHCCLPKRAGGLGILELSAQNQALLLRWLWKLKSEPDATWSTTVQNLYGSLDIPTLATNSLVSHGLKDILLCKEFFLTSIDSLATAPLPLWRWTPSGQYSAASAYSILVDPGLRSPFHTKLWKMRAPPRVKIFLWLLLLDRLLTQKNLITRNWPANDGCPCCSGQVLETSLHLFLECAFTKTVWDLSQQRFNLPILHFPLDLHTFWLQNRATLGTKWDTIWAAVSWTIWKERNSRIFSDKARPPYLLV